MNIELKEITVEELVSNYDDNAEDGVHGYNGKLNIRPPYQREFVYGDKQRKAVIDTVLRGLPLNAMYWAVTSSGEYEIIDGQQRTVSICQYVNGDFAKDDRYFHNLTKDQKALILNYKLMVYQCSGTDSEKLEWFKTINIAGEKLTDQELRNAVYSGSWVADAKRHFSKSNCAAYGLGKDYLRGAPIRQEYLETVIKWISNDNIEQYMAKHQHDKHANELWSYFQAVISWVEATFSTKRKSMKGVNWGKLYNDYGSVILDPDEVEKEVAKLVMDDDVTKKGGIYPYILSRDEKYLSIRTFSNSMKQKVYEKQSGVCVTCGKQYDISQMEADHITPWSQGGKTIEDNCQLLCKSCNRRKSDK